MIDIIKERLFRGQYNEVKKVLQKDVARDVLMTIAYETESIMVYAFISYMIKETKDEEWIKLAIDIMINPLCALEGAYSVALFHIRELLERNRSIENLEQLLFCYQIPEKLISKDEALKIIHEILELEPNNQPANMLKNKLQTT